MQSQLPLILSNDITATLSIKISIGKEMRIHAARLGYGPEELDNLCGQKIQEVTEKVAEVLGVAYDGL